MGDERKPEPLRRIGRMDEVEIWGTRILRENGARRTTRTSTEGVELLDELIFEKV